MSQRRNTVVLAIATLCGIFFLIYAPLLAMFRCPVKAITGLPCPGCGGTRAAMLLSEGHIWEAVALNPLSVALCLWFIVSYVWLVRDIIRGDDTYWKIYKKKWPRWAVTMAVVLLLANWALNIFKGN